MLQITTNFLTFSYVDVFLGTIKETNEIVTIKEYAAGDFVKYVNNTGKTHTNKNDDQHMKAESLVHFSYVKSNKKLLLVDIQVVNYTLTDPEIATLSGVFDEDKHFLFCAGNLSKEAYTNFFQTHQCSVFCNLLGLLPENVGEQFIK